MVPRAWVVRGLAAVAGLSVFSCGASAVQGGGDGAARTLEGHGGGRAESFADQPDAWLRRRSSKLHLSVALPEGAQWIVEDRPEEFSARHDATRSRLVLRYVSEDDLMNRQRCEARAKEWGWLPERASTMESVAVALPEGFDTRVWVAVEPGATSSSELRGHAFAFGAQLRKCLLFHFETTVPSAGDEEALSARLALVRSKVLPSLKVETVLESVPREAPATSRSRSFLRTGP